MKKCPLCGNEYEVENVCPICNILLIDTDSNRAVSNESEKERRRREDRERREKAREEVKEQARERATQAASQVKGQAREASSQVVSSAKSMDPKLIAIIGIGAVIIILLIIILKFVLGGNNEPQYEESVGNGAYVEEGTGTVVSDEDPFVNDNPIVFGNTYFSFEMPAYWNELCDVVVGDDYISFSQKKSRDFGGHIFTVSALTDDELYNIPSYSIIQENGYLSYVIEYSTDVSFDYENEEAKAEYLRLCEDEHYIFSSFVAKDVEMPMDADYILPGSDSRVISTSELEHLTKEEVKYARNEIYARHGRRFKDEGLQRYFDSKSWYVGTISPDAFSESMLSGTEKRNVEIIVEYEQRKGYR